MTTGQLLAILRPLNPNLPVVLRCNDEGDVYFFCEAARPSHYNAGRHEALKAHDKHPLTMEVVILS